MLLRRFVIAFCSSISIPFSKDRRDPPELTSVGLTSSYEGVDAFVGKDPMESISIGLSFIAKLLEEKNASTALHNSIFFFMINLLSTTKFKFLFPFYCEDNK